MELNIYLETTIKSPRKQKGFYGYIVEAKQEGEILDTREGFAGLEATANQAALESLLCALKRFNRPSVITIHTPNAYLADSIRKGWLEKWAENGWLSQTGREIKNRDLWRAILEQGHDLSAVLEKPHPYTGWLRREMEERRKEHGADVPEGKDTEETEAAPAGDPPEQG